MSVIGLGTFGFSQDDRNGPLHPNYVGEKLSLGNGSTTEALTDLINGVIDALKGQPTEVAE